MLVKIIERHFIVCKRCARGESDVFIKASVYMHYATRISVCHHILNIPQYVVYRALSCIFINVWLLFQCEFTFNWLFHNCPLERTCLVGGILSYFFNIKAIISYFFNFIMMDFLCTYFYLIEKKINFRNAIFWSRRKIIANYYDVLFGSSYEITFVYTCIVEITFRYLMIGKYY